MLTHPRVCLLVPAGGAHNDVEAGVNERVDIGLSGTRDGEVDGDLGPAQSGRDDLVTGVQARNQLQVDGILNRLADG